MSFFSQRVSRIQPSPTISITAKAKKLKQEGKLAEIQSKERTSDKKVSSEAQSSRERANSKKELTMISNRVKLYSSENVKEEFYEALASKSETKLRRVHIPKSDAPHNFKNFDLPVTVSISKAKSKLLIVSTRF